MCLHYQLLKKLKIETAFKNLTLSYDIKSNPLTINIYLFKQININQMFDKIQMILMMKTSISNNCISLLSYHKYTNNYLVQPEKLKSNNFLDSLE